MRSELSARVRKRSTWIAAGVTALMGAGLIVVPSVAATAAPGDLAHGVVIVDSNKNNAVDTGPTGSNDTPLGGVKVTLRGTNPDNPGVTVTTKPDGTWAFTTADATTAGPGPFTVTVDADGVNGDAYLTPTASTPGVNDFTRVSGEPQRSVSATIPADAADVQLNALVYPTWSTDVIPAKSSTGLDGNAIWTGTTPFDGGDTEPGQDSGMNNNRIRTSDVINHTWSITVDAEQDLGSNANVWFEQELKLEPGAVATFGSMPTTCLAGSQIVALPSNTSLAPRVDPPAGTTSVVLKCNLGPMGTASTAALLDTQVFVSASSTNGATFTESVRTYGATEDGVTTARPDGPHDFGPFEITAAPRYDLEKRGGFTYGGWSQRELPNGETVMGKYIYYNVLIATDRKVGVEAFKQPVTFEESLWGAYTGDGQNGPDGSINGGMEWYMTACYPATGDARQSTTTGVYGKIGMPGVQGGPNSTATNSVRDSGTCGFERQDGSSTSNYDITLSGIDASGATYPTQSVNGTALPANKYYVASYEFVMFVPRAEIDKMTGVEGDGIGQARIWNRVGDFDPKGESDASNYGTDVEPGYCEAGPNTDGATNCDTMPDGKRSNNVTGPVELKISPGVWAKEFTDQRGPWFYRFQTLPGGSGSHAGNGQVQPGQTFTSRVGVTPEEDNPAIQICDVFDNSVLKVSPLGNDTTVPAETYGGAYSQVAIQIAGKEVDRSAMPAFQSNYEIVYGHVDLTGDNPNTGVFSSADNRWEGDWSKQQAASSTACANSNVEFHADPNAVPGGIDAVNVVWAKPVNGYILDAGNTLHLLTGMEQRNTYNGGPHDGQEIPANTIAANYGNVSFDGKTWPENKYFPGAGDTGGTHHTSESPLTTGDRWSVVRAEMAIKKWSVAGKVGGVDATGVAADGVTGSAKAGSPVIWNIHPTLSAISDPAAPVNNVVITDTLPAGVEYDAGATTELGTLAPSSVTVNPNGTTTIVWNLGTRIPNQPLPELQIATHVDPFLVNNTTLTNKVNITADGIVPVAGAHNDDHSVTVTQPGSLQLKKSVDQVLDLQDKDQVFTLQVKNFSETLQIEPPTIIDVLPYNGDATNAALVNRSPASKFDGQTRLDAAPKAFLFDGTTTAPGTFYYTTADPATVPQDLNADTNPLIWSTTFTPDATAFKFVASESLGNVNEGAKSGLQITFKMNQTDNEAGNLYANRFTAFSSSLENNGRFQLLTSNQVMVRIVGFSLGDLIWFDIDNDGKFNASVDRVVPEGVKVNVYDKDGKLVPNGAVTTNKDGRWVVNDLPEGDYYAEIPASEFAAGGKLEGWDVQTVGYVADPNTDKNENADHNGAKQADNSVRTGLIHLSATVNGSVITGNEPLNDNTGNMPVTPGTTDGFTNFTLDMALKAVPGYEFTKTADPASGSTVRAGDVITYTVTGENTGKTPLEVEIKDDLSEVLAFSALVDGSLTATIEGQTGVAAPTLTGTDLAWNGSLQPGQKVVVSYKVTVAEGHEGETLNNKASSTATPPYDPPITPPDVTTEHPIPGYEFTKTANPASGSTVLPGQTITYTLTGVNTGATELDPVNISDDLSKVLNNATLVDGSLKASIQGATTVPDAVLTGTSLTWTGVLQKGETVVVTYQVKVNADAGEKSVLIENHASSDATPPGVPPITPPDVTTEHPVPGYTFTKTADPASGTAVNPGGEITYTLTGVNTGHTVLDPVVINDDLAKVLNHATVVSEPVVELVGQDSVPAATRDGDKISWTGKLEIGQTVTITYTVKLNDDAVGVIVENHADSSATPPGLPPITPPDVETWHPTPGYTFNKVADPASGNAVTAGDEITYTLTGTNAGETVLDPVVINDDMAGVLAFADMVQEPTAKIVAGGVETDATAPVVAGTKLTWTGALQKGEQIVVVYKVKVKEGFEGKTINNHADSTATPPGLPPITPPDVTTEHPIPGYEFTKSSDPKSGTTVLPGGKITYTLTGVNTGATVLDPVVIKDDLSQVLNNAKLTTDPVVTIEGAKDVPAAVLDGTSLAWTGKLEIGQTVKITYTVTLNEDTAGVIVNNHASSTATPPGLPPITPPDVVTEHPVPGYVLSKTSDPKSGSEVKAGSVITYTVTGTNTGATVLDPVVIDDDMSQVLNNAKLQGAPKAEIVSSDGTVTAATAPTLNGTTLAWTGTLQVGQKVQLVYAVKVNDGVKGVQINNSVSSTATPPGIPPITPPPVTTTHEVPGTNLSITGTSLPIIAMGLGLAVLIAGGILIVRRRREVTEG